MTEYSVESSAEVVVELNEKKRIRVLHVDDEPGLLKVAKQCLEMDGHFQVDIASSAEEAMEMMKKETYDAIVSDYKMPRKDGLEFLKELRTKGNNTPFVIFTGKGREEVTIRALNLGADGYFNKSGASETVYGELAYGICQVVEKKRATDALRESETKTRTLFENLPQKIFFKDRNSVYISCNENYARDLKIKADGVKGKTDFDFYPKELAEKYRADDKRIMDTGSAEDIDEEYIQDGQKRLVRTVKTPVKDEKGNATGVLGIFWDITERKRAEEALKNSERKYREFADSLPEIAFEVDEKGNVAFFNRRAFEILGYSQEDFRSLSIFQFLVPEDRVRVKENIEKILKGEKSGGNEYTLLRKDGSTFPVLAFTSRIVSEDGKGGLRGVIIDISEQKNIEKKLRESEEKFRNLAEQSPNMIFINQKGRVVYANQNAEDIMGYKKEEFHSPDFNFLDLIAPESKESVKSSFTKHTKGEDVAPYEYKLITREGRIIDAILATRLIIYKGEPAILGTVIDITERKKVETDLFENYSRLQNVLAASPDAIAVIDLNGSLIDCNQAALSLYGCSSKDDLIGKNVFDLIAKKDQPRAMEKMEETIEKGPVKDVLFTLVAKDGREYPAELSAVVVKDSSGNSVALVTIVRDITERKKAQEELRRFSTAVRTSLDGIITGDLNGNIADVNDAVLRMYGGTNKGDLVGKNVLDFVVESDRTRALQDSMESMRTGQGKTIEYRALTKNGTEIPVEITTAFMRDEQGEPIGFVDIVRNIAERKKAEEAFRVSQRKFESLFASNPEAAAYLGPDFCIQDVNPRFEELFGYSLAEIKGKHINEVVVPDDRKEEGESLDKDARKGYVCRNTVRRRKDGSLVPVSVSAASITGEDGIIGVVAMYHDISDLKSIGEKLEMMNEKLQVVGGLTRHDVRNKLSAITGNIYISKKKLADHPDVLEIFNDMQLNCEQIVRIFEFAQDYERLGMEELAFVDVGTMVDKAAGSFSDLKGARVANECHGLTVLADSLLERLFYNLIDNSLKYGGKLTQIRTRHEESEDGLRLIYEDDGEGISKEAKAKLFTEGFNTGKGSGYGLHLIKKMLEVYSWTIQETGEPGKGARFVMTIPKMNPRALKGKEN